MSRHRAETATKLQSNLRWRDDAIESFGFLIASPAFAMTPKRERLSAGGQKVVGHIYQMQAAQPRLPTVSST
jgi:hypothetical protein